MQPSPFRHGRFWVSVSAEKNAESSRFVGSAEFRETAPFAPESVRIKFVLNEQDNYAEALQFAEDEARRMIDADKLG